MHGWLRCSNRWSRRSTHVASPKQQNAWTGDHKFVQLRVACDLASARHHAFSMSFFPTPPNIAWANSRCRLSVLSIKTNPLCSKLTSKLTPKADNVALKGRSLWSPSANFNARSLNTALTCVCHRLAFWSSCNRDKIVEIVCHDDLEQRRHD